VFSFVFEVHWKYNTPYSGKGGKNASFNRNISTDSPCKQGRNHYWDRLYIDENNEYESPWAGHLREA